MEAQNNDTTSVNTTEDIVHAFVTAPAQGTLPPQANAVLGNDDMAARQFDDAQAKAKNVKGTGDNGDRAAPAQSFNADSEFALVGTANGAEKSANGAAVLISTYTTTLQTNTNAYSVEQLTEMCDRMSDRCKQWEDNQQRASNDVLYGLLDDCLNLYKDTQLFKDVRKNFLKLYDSKFAKAKDGTSIMTKIVRIVFGNKQKNRNFGYARVLTIADKEMKPGQSLRQFIVSAGGIEEIRRSGTGQSAAQRQEAIEAAKTALEDSKSLSANIKVDISSVDKEKNSDHNYRAALIREAADGTFSVVMVSKREAMVSSLLNEQAKRMAASTANSAKAAPTADTVTARQQSIVNNVSN